MNTSMASDDFVDAEEFSSPASKIMSPSPAKASISIEAMPELPTDAPSSPINPPSQFQAAQDSPMSASPTLSPPKSSPISNPSDAEGNGSPPIRPPVSNSPQIRPPMAPVTSSPPLGENKSSFNGDRGGDANDAELLAILKGISSGTAKSSSPSSKGASEDDVTPPVAPTPPAPTPHAPTPTAPTPSADPTPGPPASAPAAATEITEPKPTSKNWKERKQSYEVIFALPCLSSKHLHPKINPLVACSSPVSFSPLLPPPPQLLAASLPPSLDTSLPSFLKDSNAAALDAALDLAIAYAGSSSSVKSSSSSLLTSLAAALASAPFNSSRPTTSTKSRSLPTALIANCADSTNFKTVVASFLTSGITAKKVREAGRRAVECHD